MKKAVLLLSGGLDSLTVFAIAKSQGFTVHAISMKYGQRHHIELEKAKEIAKKYQAAEHRILNIDLGLFGNSALTDNIEVPKHNTHEEIGNDIPVTYVPARNTIFLSFALAYAEVINSFDIFIGVNALDYSGYPDCRPEYIESFERMANLATKKAVKGEGKYKIHTPLINMTKSEIIREGIKLGVDYSLTTSCYDPTHDGKACGRCDSCLLRLKGFKEAGIRDAIIYVAN